jgi:tricarboxylate carrier
MLRLLLGATGGLTGGLVVVSACASAVDQAVPAPTYSSKGSRYDNSNFKGRLASMLTTMDPSTLFASDDEVRKANELLKRFDRREKTDATNEQLWQARKLRDSAMHPDTGEIIPRPFRMAGYVPFNGPVCVAMMIASTTPQLLLFNWVNQSQNALVNYYNRNASSPTTNETLARSYATAVSAALLVAFGTSQLIKRRFDPKTASKLLTFVALPSSMVASSSNAYIMRSPEIETGVSLVDTNGKEIVPGARSKTAARKAVMETVYSRILLQLPTFFLPPLFMMLPPVAVAAAASPVVSITANTFVTLVGFGLGLPAAVAVFPQTGELPVDEIDNEQVKAAAKARGLTSVYYNKGL